MQKIMINEASRDKLLSPYLDLFAQRGINASLSQLKQALLKKFVNEGLMRNLSLSSNYYLAGVAKYYFQGLLTTNKDLGIFTDKPDNFNQDICQRLNALILILRNAYIDSVGTAFEQPEDFGELTLPKLLRKYNKKIDEALGIVKEKKPKEVVKPKDNLDRNNQVGNGYTFDILYSYEDAKKYNKWTEPGAWCITYGQQHYNAYVKRLGIHYVIFLKDGYQDVPRVKGPNFTSKKPQDEYGNSMIAVLQSNSDGHLVYITSRWNHGSASDNSQCEADHAYTPEEFYQVTGTSPEDLQRIFKIWEKDRVITKREVSKKNPFEKENSLTVLRTAKQIQMRINGGAPLEEVFNENIPLFGNNPKPKNNINISIFPAEIRNTETGEYYTENYLALCDRGKILFETIKPYRRATMNLFASSEAVKQKLANGDGWFSTAEDNVFGLNNIILIKSPYGVPESNMLYNTRLHQFVEVDGVKKFKAIGSTSRWIHDKQLSYIELRQTGSQAALLDVRTNQPLKLPNGSFWYEYAENEQVSHRGWSREVKPDVFYNNSSFIVITYDSSSGERYLFNTRSRKFVDISEDITNETSVRVKAKIGNNYSVIEISSRRSGLSGNKEFLLNNMTGEKVGVDGFNKFITLRNLGDGFLGYIPLTPENVASNEKSGMYITEPTYNVINMNNGEKVTYNGIDKFYTINSAEGYIGIVLGIGIFKMDSSKTYHNYTTIIYNKNTGGFEINPFTGTNEFLFYNSNSSSDGKGFSLFITPKQLEEHPELVSDKDKAEIERIIQSTKKYGGDYVYDSGYFTKGIRFDLPGLDHAKYREPEPVQVSDEDEEIPAFEGISKRDIQDMILESLSKILCK